MTPWPAPSVPRPDKQKHRRRRQAGGGHTGTVVPKGGAAKGEPCNGASRGPGHTGDGQRSTAKRTRRRSGPARTSAIGEQPRRRCKLGHGDHARNQRAEEHHSGGDRPPAERQKHPLTCRPPRGRPLPAQAFAFIIGLRQGPIGKSCHADDTPASSLVTYGRRTRSKAGQYFRLVKYLCRQPPSFSSCIALATFQSSAQMRE